MQNRERTLLIGSIILNVILLVAVVVLWQRPAATATPPTAQANLPPGTEAASASPTAASPTNTAVPATSTAEPTATVTPSPEPTLEPTTPPTQEPTPTPTVAPSATPMPTNTPEPTPIPTAAPLLTGPNWLRYVNQFRLEANLPLVSENAAWSQGAANHSFYMVANSEASHNENAKSTGYTPEGQAAAQNGNIAVSGAAGVGYTWPFDYWMSASFHALPILDPQLQMVGYGDYRDASSGFGMAATLDIHRGLRDLPPDIQFPILFPKNGGQTWVTSFTLPEFPNTLAGCPGYTQPSGAPIIVQIGSGDQTPRVTSSEILRDGTPIPHCVFTEATYTNSNSYWQGVGRQILDERDAIVLVPQAPLQVGSTYAVTVVVNGQEISWQFDVVAGPPTN